MHPCCALMPDMDRGIEDVLESALGRPPHQADTSMGYTAQLTWDIIYSEQPLSRFDDPSQAGYVGRWRDIALMQVRLKLSFPRSCFRTGPFLT